MSTKMPGLQSASLPGPPGPGLRRRGPGGHGGPADEDHWWGDLDVARFGQAEPRRRAE